MRLDFLHAARRLHRTSELDEDLSGVWPDFVDCSRRMVTLGPYLDRHLPAGPDHLVLDAAAGIGCEAARLVERGNRVIANEISPALRACLFQAIDDKAGATITNHDWRELSDALGHSIFDAVILLGNSICLLLSAADRRLALRRIYETLKPGGLLLIDQRNFALLLDRKDEVLEGRFEFRSEVMYCGRNIVGYPISVDRHEIVFAYLNPKTGWVAGFLHMSTFAEDSLESELESIGFVDIRSDFDLGRADKSTGDFIIHCCRRPS
ncbi:MAG: class I SAM-dependent methyltransferase [Terricaulis sp.]